MISVETAAWLDALYSQCSTAKGDGALAVIDPSKRRMIGMYPVGSGNDLLRVAHVMAGKNDLYLKINLLDHEAIRERSKAGQKGRYIVGRADEVKTIVSLHLDVDAGKSEKYLSRGAALDCLAAMPHPPTLIVNSDGPAGGFHAYWALSKPYRIADDADRQRICDVAKRWQNRLIDLAGGTLDSTANIDRVLRVVGGKRSSGNVVSCHEYDPHRAYTIEQLTIAPTMEEIAAEAKQRARSRLTSTLGPLGSHDGIQRRAAKYIAKMSPSVAGQNGHDRCFDAACVLVLGFNLSADTAYEILRDEFNPRCDPPWSEQELRHKVEQAEAKTGDRGYLIDKRKAG